MLGPSLARGLEQGGIIIAVGDVMANAVANALSSLRVQPRELPLTPEYVWQLVQKAHPSPAGGG